MMLGFVATPLLLRWLGAERFGSFRVLSEWLGNLTMLEFGLTGSILALLAPAVARRDEQEIRGWLSAAIRSYFRVDLAIAAAGIALIVVLPRLMPPEEVSKGELRVSAVILLFGLCLLPLSVFKGLMETEQRGYLVNAMLVAQAGLTVAATLGAARVGWGLVGQSAATVASRLPALLILTVLGTRQFRRFWQVKPKRENLKQLRRLNIDTFSYAMTGRLSLWCDNMMIHWGLGALAVAPFLLTQRLAIIVRSLLGTVGTSTWAGLIELRSHGQMDLFRRRFIELNRMVSALGLIVLGTIAAYNFHFTSRWVGGENFAGEGVSLLACLTTWLVAIVEMWTWPITSTGNARAVIRPAALSTGVNLVVGIAGTVTLGAIGPLLGTLVAYSSINLWAVPRVSKRLFGTSTASLWRAAFEPLRWALPFIAFVWWVARSHVPSGWFMLLAEMSLCGLLGLLLWWIFDLTPAGRKEWVGRMSLAFDRG